MPSLRDQFAHFYPPDENAVETAMTKGFVVPDTNVLLSLYRFQAKARDELLDSLELLGNRLWIPYQVGHEYHRNRIGAISQQERFFTGARAELNKPFADLRRQLQRFRTRLSLNPGDLKEIEDNIGALQNLVQGEVLKAGKANEIRLSNRESDKALARVEKLFGNRVGRPMEQSELTAARAEAERRGKEKIPPGYKDIDKEKGDPAGDYLIWRQLITEAKTRKLPVVFVTDDTKEDWYRRDHGILLGARPELREEMMREAGVPLLVITTAEFIPHAEKYLKAEFSKETLNQAQEFPAAVRADVVFADLAAVPPAETRWGDLFAWAGASNSDLPDALLDRIATGTTRDPAELRFIMRLLNVQVGRAEMELTVVNAVIEGVTSNRLTREGARAALTAMARELATSSDTEPAPTAETIPPPQDAA